MYIRILKQLGMKLSSGPKPLYSDFPNRPAKRERESHFLTPMMMVQGYQSSQAQNTMLVKLQYLLWLCLNSHFIQEYQKY